MFTSEHYNKMTGKQRTAAARRNMRKVMKHLKIKDKDLEEMFELDQRMLSKRLVDSKWSVSQINQIVDMMPPDEKLEMYNPKGFMKAWPEPEAAPVDQG